MLWPVASEKVVISESCIGTYAGYLLNADRFSFGTWCCGVRDKVLPKEEYASVEENIRSCISLEIDSKH
jgi:hypothetical protein